MREYIPDGNLIIFEAPQRSGKTMAAVFFAWLNWQKGRNIFSNIDLSFPHEKLKFGEVQLETGARVYWNGHIFIDELNFFFDSRRSSTAQNIKFSAFLLQQKKQGCNLTGTTHDLYSLDLRIRDAYDFIVYPEVYPRFPKVPRVLTMEIENGPTQRRVHKKLKMDCRPLMGMYDTFATYNPFEKETKSAPMNGGVRRVAPRADLVGML